VTQPTTPRSGGEILVDALRLHGVETVFCVPGESYLAALDALYGARNQIRVVTCRQEGGAGFMAEAYGKTTGKPGICFVTRGPGACNASIGVHTAMQDSTPMILFVGQVAREAMGREGFQEIDYRQMFAPPMVKLAIQIEDPARIPELVHHAFQTATSGRQGPVVVALPEDMLTEAANVADGKPYQPVRPHPGPNQLAQVSAMLHDAERPVMILGGSGWSDISHAAIAQFADANGLPVAVSFRRQDLFDNLNDLYIGDLSTSVDPKLVARIGEADVLLVVGARLGEMTTRGYTTLKTPAPSQKLLHVYPDPEELGRVFQPDLAIAAGMAEFASAAQALDSVDGGKWAEWARAGRSDYLANLEPDPMPGPVDMPAIIATLRKELPENTIITVDAGNFSGWPQRFWQFRHYPSEIAPTDGAMGYSIPAGVAAKLAAPDREVVSFVGDGGFMMTGQELATALHHGVTPIIIVINNGAYGTIRMHQERDYPDRPIATSLTNPDFAALARAYGAHGELVERTEEFAPALSRARASGTAAVIEIRLDLDVITTRTTLTAIRERATAGPAE
jgi:acetolactate synthase-1/2/3 large subunit